MSKIVQLQDNNGNDILPIGYAMGGVKMDLLWANSDITSTFPAQTINIDSSNYNLIFITFRPGYLQNFASTIINKLDSSNLVLSGNHSNSSYVISSCRELTVSDSAFIFSEGKRGYNGKSMETDGESCVPYKIYGIKTSYVVPTEVHGMQYVEV